MDKRFDTSRSGYRDDVSSHSKKTKKRSSKRNSLLGPWVNSVQNSPSNDAVPGMEYQHLLWQSNVQQNFPTNGQRLFATASDPSMCGYAQMPMTYTMEPVSLPTMYRLYQPVPLSGIRTANGRPRRHCNQNHPMNLGMNSMANGYTSLQENGAESPVPINYQNGDYMSLPPTANKTSEIIGEELNSEHRRYSDPGLGSAEAPVHTQSEESDSVDSESSITTIGRSNKLVLSLIEQMTELKKSNSQLFKELNETKSELGGMKTKLAQCKYSTSSDYQPGMLSDFIREIRQANKTSEDGLFSKVKSIVEEKLSQRSLEVVNLNNQITKLLDEKEENDRRISKLEEEVATLKLNANNEGREIAAFEEETLALRRELQEARASKSLAENHAAKRVNARSVTPVATFDTTQPYVTSTPVRTALSNTCSLVPLPPSPSSTPAPQQFVSPFLRTRTSEVAHHFVADQTNPYKTTDCSSPTPLDSSWTMESQDSIANTGDQSSTLITNTSLDDRQASCECEEKSEGNACETSTEGTGHNVQDSVTNHKEDTTETSHEDEDKLDATVENVSIMDNIYLAASTVPEKRNAKGAKGAKDEDMQRGHHQRGSSKKNKKKRGGFLSKRSFSEADRGSDASKNGGRDARRTVSEDEDRSRYVDDDDDDDDETSRAITEIPEVTVVGGGSFVPKDLCSTGILTSRVLTAPSRATYTTAYI